ncbi:hypothetical protein KJ918_04685 [Patescibacteria group bacterium]|nr:hypothetical protein [Patescibacteria group bacterium]
MQNISTLPLIEIENSKILAITTNGLFASLVDKGLNRLTDAEIEHIMCTSSLAAFN